MHGNGSTSAERGDRGRHPKHNMVSSLASCFHLVCAVIVCSTILLPTTESQTPCSTANCPADTTYCTELTTGATECEPCHVSCVGCLGPTNQDCLKCKIGFVKGTGDFDPCLPCEAGFYGVGCSSECHCLNPDKCDKINGNCTNFACERGYQNSPKCDKFCDEGFYGLECRSECHCPEGDTCNPLNGDCSSGQCHPDWTGPACSYKLPKLALGPRIDDAQCTQVTLSWDTFTEDDDIGSGPTGRYIIYKQLNGTDNWEEVGRLDESPTDVKTFEVGGGLEPDGFYYFRVDVAVVKDGKISLVTSPGNPSVLVYIPCATTTTVETTTKRIFSRNLFLEVKAVALNQTFIKVSWTTVSEFSDYEYKVDLTNQFLGHGDCEDNPGRVVKFGSYKITSQPLGIKNLVPWGRYQVTVSAVGVVVDVRDFKEVTVTTEPTAPTGKITNITTGRLEDTVAELVWEPVPCAERGGPIQFYEIAILNLNDSEATELNYATEEKRLLLARMTPYTTYSARIKYTNAVGSGPDSDIFYFSTEEEAPDTVKILSTSSTFSTITVTFQPLVVTSGVLISYTVELSLTPDFAVTESKTVKATSELNVITVERLKEETKYYIKMAASTETKTGNYGEVREVTTLKAPPPAEQITLDLVSRTTECLEVSWKPPQDRQADVSRYELEIRKATADTSIDPIKTTFQGNETETYKQCDLEPSQLYIVTVKAVAISGVISSITLRFSTGHGTPTSPINPEFVRSTYTNITVALEPVSLSTVDVTVYQVRVQPRGADNDDTQTTYIAAELKPQDIPQRIEFIVGDGATYHGYDNTVLLPNTYYMIFLVARSTLSNQTTEASSGLKDGAVRTVPYDPTVAPRPIDIVTLSSRTTQCLQFAWTVPEELKSRVTEFKVTVTKTTPTSPETKTINLSPASRSYRICELSPFTPYIVTVEADRVLTSLTTTFYTEQDTPRTPVAPTFLNSSDTTITVSLEPVVLNPDLDTIYQLKVEQVTNAKSKSAGRRKRRQATTNATPPGYITAQLTSSEIPQSIQFVVGDGSNYNGYDNKPLAKEKFYIVHFIVMTTLDNTTKQSYASLSSPVQTIPYVPATPKPAPASGDDDDDNSALIGVIIALIIIVIIIIILFLIYLWWRRRNRFNPYEIHDDKSKFPLPEFVDNYDPHKYWSPTTNLKDSRHIIVGRDMIYNAENPRGASSNGHIPDNPEIPKIAFAQEFQHLPHKPKKTTDNMARYNSNLNRFPHLLPYDHSLVQLKPDKMSRGTYINASYIPGYKKTPAYIAAQSPYDEETVLDFWRLIYQKSIKTVVMITNIVEDNVVKCTQYWPNQTKASYGNFLLHLISQKDCADYIIRSIGVKMVGSDDVKIVTLFEFTAWPDHGVPDDPIPFLEMRYKVRQYHGDEKSPILVHCGTGVARTGVFIAVDALIDQYATEGRVMVFDYVRRIRKDRPYMVRTQKQYVFIYEAIFEEFHAGDTLVDLDLKGRYHNWTQRNHRTGNSYLRDQFSLLQQFTRGLTTEDSKTARLEVNLKKNRYLDVLPPEKYRPRLVSPGGINPTDYINAFYVDGYVQKNQFIITQTPLHTTIIDFWKLVYDHDVRTIVMMESFKNEDDSVGEYWPNVNLKQFEPFFIETKASYQEANITIRNFKITSTTNPKEPAKMVRQFQFNVWEEPNSTPNSKTMLLDLIDYVFDWQEESCGNERPVVVHCKDGASHSGLFASVAVCCERMEEDEEVDVYRTVKHIKRRRNQCVDDYDQFRFCYKSVWDFMNLRMQGGQFTDTLGQTKTDKVYGVASLSLTNSYFETINHQSAV